ncbi:DMT family transporter [Zavarzinia compransoris]|uniref:EamA/RhaT family transporter n=1 Tax=Zavarzinia compransoris TaxID=1264899 RepID=A0A317EA67_9PROT|nr:DMT family transporter [Zavarzinia compransoris]PWR22055.1 EamA/RhaT family transporter [Zavarzinia compransoris]TDP47203.1 EamA-like transporter family protein [Zavarzinia compransoris]
MSAAADPTLGPATLGPAAGRWRGYGFGLLGVAIWAGWIVLTRFDLRGSVAITDLVALRFATAGLILLPVLIRRGLPLRRLGPAGLFGMAACAGAPYVLVAGGGHAFAPATHSGVLICCGVPLAAAMMSRLLLGERFSTARKLGYSLILAAAVVLMAEAALGGSEALGDRVLVGDGMFVAGALLWAGYTIMARHFGLEPLHATAIVAVLSAVFYLPVYGLFLSPGIAAMSAGQIATQVVYQGIVTSIVSLLAFTVAIRLIGASTTAALTALVPAGASVLAIPVLGEWPTAIEAAGVALGTAGVMLASGAIAGRGRR